MEAEIILEVKHLQKVFSDSYEVRALDDVSAFLRAGEILGVVGESGSGKSTLARAVTRLIEVDAGEIWLCGQELGRLRGRALRRCYEQMQMVFQNATASFDPRMTVGKSIGELLENFFDGDRQARETEVRRLLRMVGLKEEYAERLPGQISGGECQRAAIARAIAVKPRLLICDEVTSALDVSVQAQVVELIQRLAGDMNMAVLFISHDLALVSSLCDRVMVMYRGRVVETGEAHSVITCPQDEYTKRLKASVFSVEVSGE